MVESLKQALDDNGLAKLDHHMQRGAANQEERLTKLYSAAVKIVSSKMANAEQISAANASNCGFPQRNLQLDRLTQKDPWYLLFATDNKFEKCKVSLEEFRRNMPP